MSESEELQLSQKRELILIIIHSSIGELQWILPYANYLKKKEDYEIVTVFFSDKVLESVKREGVYYSLLEEVSHIIPKRRLFKFLLLNSARVRFVFKDFWPIHPGSLATKIRDICSRSVLILYPHSYALYGYEERKNPYEHKPESHHEDSYDLLLVNTKYDVSYWSKLIRHERIKVIGALGYDREWVDKLISRAYELKDNDDVDLTEFRFRILFAVRGPKPILLEEEDYDFLMDTALEELFGIEQAFVYIKPHPRQDIDALKEKLKDYPPDRYAIVYENPFVVGKKVDFAVNFWTSVTTDLLVLDIPSIEYYRFKGDYSKWLTLENGEKTSYYNHLGLTQSVNNQLDLHEALKHFLTHLNVERELRKERFVEVFQGVRQAGERMVDVLQTAERRTSGILSKKIIGFIQVLLSSLKSMVK